MMARLKPTAAGWRKKEGSYTAHYYDAVAPHETAFRARCEEVIQSLENEILLSKVLLPSPRPPRTSTPGTPKPTSKPTATPTPTPALEATGEATEESPEGCART